MIEFDWLIHHKCNYRCSYCFFSGMWEEVEKQDKDISQDMWVTAWRRISRKYGKIKLIITGGEPFIYPGFIELINKLQKFSNIAFDTNLSCGKEQLYRFVREVSPEDFSMGVSFHPEFSDMSEFTGKLDILRSNGFDFRVHYVTYPPQLNKLKDHKAFFGENGHRFVPIPFRGRYNGRIYPKDSSEEEKEIIKAVLSTGNKNDNEWASNQVVQVRSRGKMCHAGQYYARVESDGSVYPCGNDYTKHGKDSLLLGNIFDDGFSMKDAPMVCRQDTCPCEFKWMVKEGSLSI